MRTARSRTSGGNCLGIITIFLTEDSGIKPGTVQETPREIALCAQTVESNSMLVINDTHADDRFAANPLVVGEPFIRFYAGYPLHGPRGWNIGSLCIIDQEPRAFPDAEQKVLRAMAAVVQNRIDTGS